MTATAAAPMHKSESTAKNPAAISHTASRQEADGAATLTRLMQAGVVRAKLTIGSPNDPEEAVADRTADSVMDKGGACCANCDSGGASGETLRLKPAPGSTARAGSDVSHAAMQLGSGMPLPSRLQGMFEPRFGRSLANIRLHTDDRAGASARSIGARAFALGPQIAFAPGQYQPDSRDGQRLIAHEVAHAVHGHSGVRRNGGTVPVGEVDERITAPAVEPVSIADTTPRRPSKGFFYFQSYTVSADREFMRGEIRALIGTMGLDRADDWIRALVERDGMPGGGMPLPFSAHTRGYGGLRVRNPLDAQRDMTAEAERARYAAEAIPVADSVYREVRAEALEFLDSFAAQARLIVGNILTESEARTEAERLRYGLERREVPITRTRHDGFARTTVHDVRTEDTMSDTVPGKGLAGAAQDLLAKREEISDIAMQQFRLHDAQNRGQMGIAMVLPERNVAEHARLAEQKTERERELAMLRATYEDRYPILVRFSNSIPDLNRLASGRTAAAATMLNDEIFGTLENIRTVRSELTPDGRVNVWKLPEIVALTKSAARVNGESSLSRFRSRIVDDKVRTVIDDEQFRDIVLTVLTIGLAIIAAIPSGGSSLIAGTTAAAGIGGIALSVSQATEHLEQYRVESAMAGSDFDRARAISSEEPSLFWLAVDIVGAVIDLGGAARATRELMIAGRTAFRRLASPVRRAINAAEGAAFAESLTDLRRVAAEAEAAHNAPGLATRVVASAERIRGASGSVERSLGRAAGHEALAIAKGSRELERGAQRALARAPTQLGGHMVSVLPNGWIVRCSVCGTLRAEFAVELARSPDLARRVFAAEDLAAAAARASDSSLATRAVVEARLIADELEAVRRTRDIRLYRGVPRGAIDDMYLMDNRLVVEMPFVGRGASSTNAAGWLRDSSYYWEELVRIHPEAFSPENLARIRGTPPLPGPVSPVNDLSFRSVFTQYDVRGLRGEPLIHHHIGGGGQSVAIPAPLHPGSGGIHNVEKAAGVWGGEDVVADVLQRLLENTTP